MSNHAAPAPTVAQTIAAVEAIEAEIADAMATDDSAYDAELADRLAVAVAAMRAARIRAIIAAPSDRWVVRARNLDTHRSLRTEVTAQDTAGARAAAAAVWAGRRYLVDSVTLVAV